MEKYEIVQIAKIMDILASIDETKKELVKLQSYKLAATLRDARIAIQSELDVFIDEKNKTPTE